MLQPEERSELFFPGTRYAIDASNPVQAIVTNGLAYMQEAMPRFTEDLHRLTLIDSPSEHKEGLDTMADQLAALLQRFEMQTTIVEHARGNALIGTLIGDNPHAPTCLLIGHHDTVHPVGSAQARTKLDGETLHGPGTVDMKGGLLQGIYALEILKQHDYRNFKKLIFLSVPDEEISNRYQASLVRQIARDEMPYVLGLEGASAVGTVVTRRKGCAHYRLTAEGRAAHAGSSPEKGRNAVLELAHQIVQAQSFMGWRPGFTINAGPITGGSRANIVSDFAQIMFDIRFLRPEDRVDAEARWRELLHSQLVPDVQLTLTSEPDSMVPMAATEASLGMAEKIRFITENILHTRFAPETRGGASDCCKTADEGCPSIDGLGAIGSGAHTATEYVKLPPIPKRVALLAGLIVAITSESI